MPITLDGTNGMTLPGANTGVQLGSLTSGTSKPTTSGTTVQFTEIPSWVSRITVTFQNVSTNGTSFWTLRIGTGGAVLTTGYATVASTITASAASASYQTSGFTTQINSAAYNITGAMILVKHAADYWVCTYQMAGSLGLFQGSGGVTLSGPLDIIRLTTINGTDTFDAGSVNIMYE